MNIENIVVSNHKLESDSAALSGSFWRRACLVVLLLAIGNLSGCSWFFPQEPQNPETVQEFMRQPRPGNGIMGR